MRTRTVDRIRTIALGDPSDPKARKVPLYHGGLVLPESPRWLLSRNRLDRCSKVLENIASKNGRKVPESLQETLQAIVATQSTETNFGAVQLFKYRVMAIRTLLLTVC
ncbi:Carcinine transporter [Portunus trituberculatus]|uniref:Carcinine transporter n=1 Tax=Portunus trituberculatus TaxID=210409 RepID=A0A5B7HX75_PORTR|nr:Carcinine transporter [Portunus trituberculatus]